MLHTDLVGVKVYFRKQDGPAEAEVEGWVRAVFIGHQMTPSVHLVIGDESGQLYTRRASDVRTKFR
jgi:hypothetical protein